MKLSLRNTPFRLSLGTRGEMLGWAYLSSQGYKILEKNYRCRIGEIDVVAEKNGKIIFIEIKTRTSLHCGEPEESVHAFKQQKLIRLAEWYLKEKKLGDITSAFHVLAVTYHGKEAPGFRLIENAFTADNRI